MKIDEGESYTAQYGGYDFLVTIGDELPLCLTVHPVSLPEEDTRAVKVIKTTDTETDEDKYSVVLPDKDDEEQEMWGIALRLAVIFMSQFATNEDEV